MSDFPLHSLPWLQKTLVTALCCAHQVPIPVELPERGLERTVSHQQASQGGRAIANPIMAGSQGLWGCYVAFPRQAVKWNFSEPWYSRGTRPEEVSLLNLGEFSFDFRVVLSFFFFFLHSYRIKDV